jgi:pheromone shutdown protein TraB
MLRRQRGAAVRHTLELTAPRDYVVVEIDAGRIEQVLTEQRPESPLALARG